MQARSGRLTAGLGQHQSYSSKYKDRYKTCQGQGLSRCFKTQITFAGLTPPKLHLDTFKVTQKFFLQNQLFFEMACSALGRDRIDLPRAESSFCHRCHSPLFCAGLQPTRPSIIGIFNYGTTMPQLKVMLVIRIFSGSILQRCTAASPSQTPLRLLGPSSLIGQIGDHSL